MRFAVLDFHWALNGVCQQSDEVNDEWYDAYHRDATARLGV